MNERDSEGPASLLWDTEYSYRTPNVSEAQTH